MKAFLLAAGKGSRLRPLTDRIPKCLVPIRGKPLLQIWLEQLARYGVAEVLINAHHHADQVEAFLQSRRGKPRIRLVHEPVLLGSGGTVWANRDFVSGEDDFWVIYGDNLSCANLREMEAFHRAHGGIATIGLFRCERPTECGIAVLDESDRILDFEEKPTSPKGDLANGGIYLLSREIFHEVCWDVAMPLDFGFHVLPQLRGKMYGYVIHDYHMDIGTPAGYERAQGECPEYLAE
ncbi:MAG: nucleotidyltransferase family protein [Deltaproteobacteria bacterium]|nr:nucleotidyltransferase family protein [Deltaproteobacteria bacterium]MBW2122187.1 nucleotidyltransferase family protein [Deltaproteobacteria bacterium]